MPRPWGRLQVDVAARQARPHRRRGRVPSELDVAIEASVPEPHVTAGGTATVRVAFRNTAVRAREFGFGIEAPFPPGVSEGGPPHVVLVRTDVEPTRPRPDCWKPAEDGAGTLYALPLKEVTLGPDEALGRDLRVWGHDENPAGVCLPDGEFRFEHTYPVGSAGGRLDWGFDLAVESP